MARGRSQVQEIDHAEGQAIWQDAKEAHANNWAIFTCAITVGTTASTVMSQGRHVQHDTVSYARLIEAIELVGWRLEHINHIWLVSQQGNPTVSIRTLGVERAHMVFRRTDA